MNQLGIDQLEWSPSRWINDNPARLWAFLGAAGLLLFGLFDYGVGPAKREKGALARD